MWFRVLSWASLVDFVLGVWGLGLLGSFGWKIGVLVWCCLCGSSSESGFWGSLCFGEDGWHFMRLASSKLCSFGIDVVLEFLMAFGCWLCREELDWRWWKEWVSWHYRWWLVQMMFNVQGASKNTCGVLAVLCGRTFEEKQKQDAADTRRYPFPEIVSSGRLEVWSDSKWLKFYVMCSLCHHFVA